MYQCFVLGASSYSKKINSEISHQYVSFEKFLLDFSLYCCDLLDIQSFHKISSGSYNKCYQSKLCLYDGVTVPNISVLHIERARFKILVYFFKRRILCLLRHHPLDIATDRIYPRNAWFFVWNQVFMWNIHLKSTPHLQSMLFPV